MKGRNQAKCWSTNKAEAESRLASAKLPSYQAIGAGPTVSAGLPISQSSSLRLGILPSTLWLLGSLCMEPSLGAKSVRWGKHREGTSQHADGSSGSSPPISHVLTPAQRCSRNKPRVCLSLPPPSFFTGSYSTSSIFISINKANSSTNWMSWTRRRLCAHELLQQARDTEDTELRFPSSTSGASKLPVALVLGALISSADLCRHPHTSDTHSYTYTHKLKKWHFSEETWTAG